MSPGIGSSGTGLRRLPGGGWGACVGAAPMPAPWASPGSCSTCCSMALVLARSSWRSREAEGGAELGREPSRRELVRERAATAPGATGAGGRGGAPARGPAGRSACSGAATGRPHPQPCIGQAVEGGAGREGRQGSPRRQRGAEGLHVSRRARARQASRAAPSQLALQFIAHGRAAPSQRTEAPLAPPSPCRAPPPRALHRRRGRGFGAGCCGAERHDCTPLLPQQRSCRALPAYGGCSPAYASPYT